MPELPEVETMRRGIAMIAGSRIAEVRRPPSPHRPIQIRPPVAELRRRATGRVIAAVGRIGKRVVLELDDGQRLVIEPRMTGRVLLAEPPDLEHLRLVLELSGRVDRRLAFWDSRGLGVVQLMSPEDFSRRLGPDRIGPDALEVPLAALGRRLCGSRRPIKVALMDQRAVAGIGNLYASEILHRARVHPATACDRLRPTDWRALHAAVGEVLHEAILCQGSTLADGTYANAANEAGGFQERHRVYQRAGQRCLQCGRRDIQRIVQAQRSTFYCPGCQRRRPAGRSSA